MNDDSKHQDYYDQVDFPIFDWERAIEASERIDIFNEAEVLSLISDLLHTRCEEESRAWHLFSNFRDFAKYRMQDACVEWVRRHCGDDVAARLDRDMDDDAKFLRYAADRDSALEFADPSKYLASWRDNETAIRRRKRALELQISGAASRDISLLLAKEFGGEPPSLSRVQQLVQKERRDPDTEEDFWPLSGRIRNVLRRVGVKTLAEAQAAVESGSIYSECAPNYGPASHDELLAFLKYRGLRT